MLAFLRHICEINYIYKTFLNKIKKQTKNATRSIGYTEDKRMIESYKMQPDQRKPYRNVARKTYTVANSFSYP